MIVALLRFARDSCITSNLTLKPLGRFDRFFTRFALITTPNCGFPGLVVTEPIPEE